MNPIKRFLLNVLPVNPALDVQPYKCSSSEACRRAEMKIRNRRRIFDYETRYMDAFGKLPKLSPYRFGGQAQTNATVIKFPRRKHQYIGASLPSGPEAA